jgi:hypothetical protein
MTPRLIAWLVGIALVAVLGAVLLGGPIVGFWKAQTAKWQAREETATDTAVSNGAETDAQAALGAAQGQITERVIERTNTITRYVEQASGAPDAKAPLGPDREQRIADHDRSLCEQRPSVCPGGTSAKGSDPGVR